MEVSILLEFGRPTLIFKLQEPFSDYRSMIFAIMEPENVFQSMKVKAGYRIQFLKLENQSRRTESMVTLV